MRGLLMSATKRDGGDVGLHAFGEGADLIFKAQRPRAAEGRGEKSLIRAHRGSSPRVSKGVAGVDALPHGRASAPIEAREQSCEACFFKNVAGVVAGDGIATQPDVDTMGEKLLKLRAPVTELGV